MNLDRLCGDRICLARVVAYLSNPHDPSLEPGCDLCLGQVARAVEEFQADKSLLVRSAHSVIVGRL